MKDKLKTPLTPEQKRELTLAARNLRAVRELKERNLNKKAQEQEQAKAKAKNEPLLRANKKDKPNVRTSNSSYFLPKPGWRQLFPLFRPALSQR